ncbi:MAG: response regulator [Bryobacterales bacterium]
MLDVGFKQREALGRLLRLNPWVLWTMVCGALIVPLLGAVAIYYQHHVGDGLKQRWSRQNGALAVLDSIEKHAYRLVLEAYGLAAAREPSGSGVVVDAAIAFADREGDRKDFERAWQALDQGLNDYRRLAEAAGRGEFSESVSAAAKDLRRAAIDLAGVQSALAGLDVKKAVAEQAERRFEAEVRRAEMAEVAVLEEVLRTGERATARAQIVVSAAWVAATMIACALGFLFSKQQRDAALEAGRLKGRFLANMSHEIRTPMNVIIGMTELVLDTPLQPGQRRHLSMVKGSAESLLALINDILDFSKIEAGRLELQPAEFSIAETLAESTRGLAVRAHQKGLKLTCNVHPDIPETLVGDSVRLKQVIINLVGNAIRFTEHGVIRVRARLWSETSRGVVVQFAVSDTGVGIAVEKQRLIFDSFVQADDSISRRHGGTGLGLSISLQLVKLMGGDISVNSQPGQGSTFSFTACFERAQPAPPLIVASELQGTRVLILDRDPVSRQALAAMVGTWGMEAAMADSSSAARVILDLSSKLERKFSILVVNLETIWDEYAGAPPDPGGDTLLQTAPLILVADREPGAKCSFRFRADYLVKPVSPSRFLEAMQAALRRAGDQASSPQAAEGSTAGREAAMPHSSVHALLVEDIVENQLLMKEILSLRGYAVTVAANGREALQAFDQQRFDLILMDIQMPEMGGVETTKLIRQREQEAGGHTPIIAVTAHAIKGDRERYLSAGMDGYVTKPLRRQRLFEEIDALIGQTSARA